MTVVIFLSLQQHLHLQPPTCKPMLDTQLIKCTWIQTSACSTLWSVGNMYGFRPQHVHFTCNTCTCNNNVDQNINFCSFTNSWSCMGPAVILIRKYLYQCGSGELIDNLTFLKVVKNPQPLLRLHFYTHDSMYQYMTIYLLLCILVMTSLI